MSQPLEIMETTVANSAAEPDKLPIVIVGNGPAGVHAVRELLRRGVEQPIIVYGDEPYRPYNRVRLSSLLAGEATWDALITQIETAASSRIEERFGIEVTHLHPRYHLLEDSSGRIQAYQHVILATGSRAHIPSIAGIELPGVFTFRNLHDTQQLLARQARSQQTIVLGGGLLGMEAARGMQRANTNVTLVEHADRLLVAQLDEGGSHVLQQRVENLGIQVVIGDGVRRVLGEARVEGIELQSGKTLACDTLVVATGIRPRTELARQAGIAIGRGIKVSDSMQTSAPDIYAVGECAEHRDRVYGLVAPGLEQAAVAVSHITGQSARYTGSLAASRLKVVGCPVFSAGPMGAGEDPIYGDTFLYRDSKQKTYRKIMLRGQRLVGAIGIGDWPESNRLQQAIAHRQYIWPWQLLRFRRRGQLWPQDEQQSVSCWPASATVCQCTGATRGAINNAIVSGADKLEAVSQSTGAGSVCGSCRPLVQELLGATATQPAHWHKLLLTTALISVLACLAILLLPPIPYPDTVQVGWRWDALWRESLLKQVTGFSVLGLFLTGLLLTPRKRMQAFHNLGQFDLWRLGHILLGILVIVVLATHTGGRLGEGLNQWLMLSFTLTLILGAFASGTIGLEHRIGGSLATRLRRKSVWWHILMFWPVPILLGFHILKGYWY